MHIRIIVPTQLALLLLRPLPHRLLDVPRGVLAADHEADLAGGIGRDRGVGVLGDGEDLAAGALERRDEREVQPLVLRCEGVGDVSRVDGRGEGGGMVRNGKGFARRETLKEMGPHNLA